MHALRLALPALLFIGSLLTPSSEPSRTAWNGGRVYRRGLPQDEETAFVVEQSHERSGVVSAADYSELVRVRVHAVGAITKSTPTPSPARSGTLSTRQTGWFLLDGTTEADRTRALWRLDVDGQIDQLESLPSELWEIETGEWSYLASATGLQVARIFYRVTDGDQGEQDIVESLTGLTVPPRGIVVVLLDAVSGAELATPVVLQAPGSTRWGRPSAFAYWQLDGTMLLTDGGDFPADRPRR